jgi:hypothetical protein
VRAADSLRASDEDRLEVSERLRDATAAGRITLDELDDRLELAWAAKTRGDLTPLTADLPAAATSPGPPLLVRRRLSSLRREGYWEPPAQIDVRASMASIRLDLTQAKVSTPIISIDVHGWCSDVHVIVPTGARVDLSALTTPLGSCEVRGAASDDDGVLVVISGRMTLGSVKARRLTATEAFFRRTFGR